MSEFVNVGLTGFTRGGISLLFHKVSVNEKINSVFLSVICVSVVKINFPR